MRAFAWTALQLCAVWLLVAATVTAGEPELVSKSPFGVGCPWPGMDQAGIRWCRVGAGATSLANWPEIQPSPDVWDWSRSDSELKNSLDSQGVSVLPILGYTPKWASRAPEGAAAAADVPRDIGAYAHFAHECVSRYKGRIKVWEVWNEPEVGFLKGSAADYAEMVRAVCVAAKQADPECRIAMGCAGVNTDFLARLYEFGCGPYFDIMSVHPYQWGKELND
jgi:large repetitive protein